MAAVSQAREGIRAQIRLNPARVTIHRLNMVSDGFGGIIPDPLGEPDTFDATVRISHESASVPSLSDASIGLSTNLSRFILADHRTKIQEGDRFNHIGYGWEVGFVDPLMHGSQVIGYQAPLKMADPFPEPYIEDDDGDGEENGEEDENDETTE